MGNHREYTSVVFAGAEPLGTGHGPTKQEAEQEAAKAALESLVGAIKPSSAVKPPRVARTRSRRGPKPRPIQAAETAAEGEAAEPAEPAEAPAPEVALAVVPEPPAEAAAEDGAPEPPRSRQFGAPIE